MKLLQPLWKLTEGEKKGMRILALDCATKTGWALVTEGRILESGVLDFAKRRGESNGSMFLRFRVWLQIMLREVDFVVYEMAHHRGGAATEICVNLTGRVQELCAAKKIEYSTVHSGTLKKWACGGGKADKQKMLHAALIYLGRPAEDDNEADAVLMGMWAWQEYGGSEAHEQRND
jgi:Holliday junction resolvasome RuvABC endonuclease subunit